MLSAGSRVFWLAACTAIAWVFAERAVAEARYHLVVPANRAVQVRLVFALATPESASNSVTLLTATHDGTGTVTSTSGGPVRGAMLKGASPADTTILKGAAFYTELNYLLSGVSRFECDLSLTNSGPSAGAAASSFTLYYRGGDGNVRVASADPTDAQALAVIDMTGDPGGELTVFAPLTLVPPDTLLLDAVTTDVELPRSSERAWLASVSPNPASHAVLLGFQLPRDGFVNLRVFDLAGRVVAEPVNGVLGAGKHQVAWNTKHLRGTSGTFFAQLRFESQTSVRRFTVLR